MADEPVLHNEVRWLVRPPEMLGAAERFGKTQLCRAANSKGMTGVIQKQSEGGAYWAVLRADAVGHLTELIGKLKARGYNVTERPREVPSALLLELGRKPVAVLPSAESVHSYGSSGALDRSEIPQTPEEEDRLTMASALTDAAAQAALSAHLLRRAELAKEKAEREAKEEREKGERAVKEEREKGEREREKAERERAALVQELRAAEARAAASAAKRSCTIV